MIMKASRKIRFDLTLILITAFLTVLVSAAAAFGLSAPSATGMTNSKEGVVLRKSSSVSSKRLGVIGDNTRLTIHKEIYKKKSSTAAKDRWYYVTAGGRKGYVRADLVDTVRYRTVKGRVTSTVKYRKGAGTGMKSAGKYRKNASVKVVLAARPLSKYRGSSNTWYKVKAGSRYYYVCSSKVKLIQSKTSSGNTGTQSEGTGKGTVVAPANQAGANLNEKQFEDYLTQQGFPKAYRKKLKALHKTHPNWGFVAYSTKIKWTDALARQTRNGASLVHGSYGSKYRSGSRQVEPGWYNAGSTVVAYYMDPRNFLTEDRIMMFEDLTYKPAYQTASVVSTILAPTKLPSKGFTANIFINAAKKNNVSPVFLAARARQEVGGGSDAINGVTVLGTKVYNPFNIGAFGGTNPLYNGLLYARTAGWTTPAKAVDGGAAELSKYYISKGQHTIYYQRFNVRNGAGNVGTHQYMTNIHAPYNESRNTKESYKKYGILNQPLVFEIPVYSGMPSSTKLP
ncbi:MAG: hypothetical protein IKE74_03965 [Mogibacterium sp.]|nr:hypothetical protein [Mogibacterium sp.]